MAKLVTIEVKRALQSITLTWSNGENSIVRGDDELCEVIIHQKSRGLKLLNITGPEREFPIKCSNCGEPIHVWDCETSKKMRKG